MSRFVSVVTILTAASVSLADRPRTNLVAIVTDDQAVWTIGCYGYNQDDRITRVRIVSSRTTGRR